VVEWIEVKGPTVEIAVQVAMTELGMTEREAVDVEVLEEPDKGFLGIGRRDAVVRVKRKPAGRRRRTRGRGSSKEATAGSGGASGKGGQSGDGGPVRGGDGGQRRGQGRGNGGRPQGDGRVRGAGSERNTRDQRGDRSRGPRQASGTGNSRGRGSGGTGKQSDADQVGSRSRGNVVSERSTEEVDTGQQADVVREFLDGLLDAFGLEGEIDVRVEDDVIYADMSGEQTEALIGDKAVIMYAIHELVRTVVQRKTMAGARVRLDIGGYGERRRQALVVYAGRLAEQVLDDGEEIMLEPMNPSDRKVVHDAIAEIDGVRSFSEGEDPRRSVVIAADD